VESGRPDRSSSPTHRARRRLAVTEGSRVTNDFCLLKEGLPRSHRLARTDEKDPAAQDCPQDLSPRSVPKICPQLIVLETLRSSGLEEYRAICR